MEVRKGMPMGHGQPVAPVFDGLWPESIMKFNLDILLPLSHVTDPRTATPSNKSHPSVAETKLPLKISHSSLSSLAHKPQFQISLYNTHIQCFNHKPTTTEITKKPI